MFLMSQFLFTLYIHQQLILILTVLNSLLFNLLSGFISDLPNSNIAGEYSEFNTYLPLLVRFIFSCFLVTN